LATPQNDREMPHGAAFPCASQVDLDDGEGRTVSSGMIIGRDALEWRVLVPISFRLFGLACRLAVESRAEGDRPDISPPAGAVVLSVAALESFVNEQADSSGHGDAAAAANIETALREREFPDRWDAFVRATCNVSFERGKRPFQAFDRLHELRNAIVHYRPHFLVPGELPDTRRGRVLANLRHDFALRDGPKNAPWTHSVLSPACAAWACRTARDMVRAHFDVTGQRQSWADRYAAMWPLPPDLEAAPTRTAT
jgi:hypothetical protein